MKNLDIFSRSTPEEGPALVTPYDATTPYTVPPGENLARFHEDGSVTIDRKEPEERSNTWKDSRKIQACGDDKISVIMTSTSGIVYYRIGEVSVSWRGLGNGVKRQFLCHTHRCNQCPHTKRINRYRNEHLMAVER